VKTENKVRLILFIAVAAAHGILMTRALTTGAVRVPAPEHPRVMKLTGLAEAPPAPPPEPEKAREREPEKAAEAMVSTMVETTVEAMPAAGAVPEQTAPPAAPASPQPGASPPSSSGEEYLPVFQVSLVPRFDRDRVGRATVYPAAARRSGIEGRVILELFIDRAGYIQRIALLREDPPGWGFGEAAVRAFAEQRCIPAEVNGQAVPVRYRYPVSFKLR
jgi:protein TonB